MFDTMTLPKTRAPMPIGPVPDGIEPEHRDLITTLLGAHAANPTVAGTDTPPDAASSEAHRPARGLPSRLGDRITASRINSKGFATTRRRRSPQLNLCPGVCQTLLYAATESGAQRPGEPLRVSLIELEAGAVWQPSDQVSHHHHREMLIVTGSVLMGDHDLGLRDYRVLPAGQLDAAWVSDRGALVFLRESVLSPAIAGSETETETETVVLDADAGWPHYGPGIRRRVLWQRDGMAAMLYHVDPGSSVPLHQHGHDEECLMVQGDLFLNDLLLQAGDYQLAPAGTSHHTTSTDTGAVIYAHGDLDLQFIA